MRKYFCRKCGQLTTKTHLLCSACKKKIYAEIEKVDNKPKKKNNMLTKNQEEPTPDEKPESESEEKSEEGVDTSSEE